MMAVPQAAARTMARMMGEVMSKHQITLAATDVVRSNEVPRFSIQPATHPRHRSAATMPGWAFPSCITGMRKVGMSARKSEKIAICVHEVASQSENVFCWTHLPSVSARWQSLQNENRLASPRA